MADTRYYQYRSDGSFGGVTYLSDANLEIVKAALPDWTFELVKRPVPPPPYVTPTFEIEREYTDGSACLHSTAKVVWGFYPHEGDDPTQHSPYRPKEADYTIAPVAALVDNTPYQPSTMVSTDNGLWECISLTNSGVLGTGDALRPPLLGRVATNFWNPVTHWDGNKVLLLRGKTTAHIGTDSIAVDPTDFMASIVVEYRNGGRYGFGLYAGANKPTTLFGATTGVTEGIVVFVGTSQVGATIIYIFNADGTTSAPAGPNDWAVSNGATAIGNKRLSVPRTCNFDDTTNNKINIQILHRYGRVVIAFDGVVYGEYIYDPDTYPFRFAQDPNDASAFAPVRQHQIHTGLIGFGDDDSAPPSSVFVHSLEVGKVNPEQLRAVL